MNLSIELNDLEQELNIYCKAHQCSANEVVRLALKRLFSATVEPKLSPYELGKDGFGSDETHEGDIAQNSTAFLRARFKNADS